MNNKNSQETIQINAVIPNRKNKVLRTLFHCIQAITLVIVCITLTACGKGENNDGGSITLKSQTFPEIQNIRSDVSALLIVDDKTCTLSIAGTTKVLGVCKEINFDTHVYKLEYRYNQGNLLLATSDGTLTLKSDSNNTIDFASLVKDYDEDQDGHSNIAEIIGGGDPNDENSAPRLVASITINPVNDDISLGTNKLLTWSVEDNQGNAFNDAPLVWSSSDTAVATVGETTGEVMAIANGTFTITATDLIANVAANVQITAVGGENPNTSGQLPVSLSNGLIAYYPFNANALDESENNNDGIVVGSTLVKDRFENETSAFSFDGNDYITSENNEVSFGENSNFSVNFWVKIPNDCDDLNYCGGFVSKMGINGENNGFQVGYHSEGVMRVEYRPSNGNLEITHFQGDSNIIDDSWHLLTFVADKENNTLKLYTDSILENLVFDEVFSGSTKTTNPFYVGMLRSRNYHYIGLIDDIRIYNRAITDGEIQALYHEGGWDNE